MMEGLEFIRALGSIIVEYWQSRVKITQIPLEIEEVIYTDANKRGSRILAFY